MRGHPGRAAAFGRIFLHDDRAIEFRTPSDPRFGPAARPPLGRHDLFAAMPLAEEGVECFECLHRDAPVCMFQYILSERGKGRSMGAQVIARLLWVKGLRSFADGYVSLLLPVYLLALG